MVRWLFVDRSKEAVPADLRDFINNAGNTSVKNYCCSQYSSLNEAAAMKRSYSIVSYSQSADLNILPPQGPWCTCAQWATDTICPHVVCIAYSMGLDSTPQALRDWATVTTFFNPPRQKRDGGGLIQEPSIPTTARYGIEKTTRNKRRRVNEELLAEAPNDSQNLVSSPDIQQDERADALPEDANIPRVPEEQDYTNITWPTHPPCRR